MTEVLWKSPKYFSAVLNIDDRMEIRLIQLLSWIIDKFVCFRFVTGGGPSVDKLMPGDQILSINGEDVARYKKYLKWKYLHENYFRAPRDHVIQLVRNCREKVSLVVCQPPLDNVSFILNVSWPQHQSTRTQMSKSSYPGLIGVTWLCSWSLVFSS